MYLSVALVCAATVSAACNVIILTLTVYMVTR